MARRTKKASTTVEDPFRKKRGGEIYRKAAELIDEKGFDATSMNEIAEAVQLTKAGLYYYVKGKKELLFKITSLAMDLLESQVIEPARPISGAEDRLRAIISSHARLLTHDNGALAILTDEVSRLSPKDRAAIVERKRDYFELVRGTLDELAADGKLRPLDTTVTAFSLLGMVMWIARWYKSNGRLSSQEVVGNITEIALGTLIHNRESAPSVPLPQAM